MIKFARSLMLKEIKTNLLYFLSLAKFFIHHSNESILKSLWPTWPSLDVSEQSISWARSCNLPIINVINKRNKSQLRYTYVLTMAHQSVCCCKSSPITCADDESLSSIKSSCWWQSCHEVTHETETDGTTVEAWRMSSSTIPASSFIDNSSVTDAEIVPNVSPSVWVHMEVLNSTHFSVTCSLRCATISLFNENENNLKTSSTT